MGHKKVSYQEKNERRRKYRDTTPRHQQALRLRRSYGGTFGDPHLCHPFNYNLMVTGTSKDGDVRRDKEGDWA